MLNVSVPDVSLTVVLNHALPDKCRNCRSPIKKPLYSHPSLNVCSLPGPNKNFPSHLPKTREL